MPSTKFDADTAVTPVDGGYRATIDPAWWIVFGPNGGYVAAIILRAMAEATGDAARQPRSLTIHYTAAPVEGEAFVSTVVERAGRSLSTVTARMEQDGRLIAIAIGAFSSGRRGLVDFAELPPPDVKPPEELETVPYVEGMPVFAKQWETRPALGGWPFSGGEAVSGGWIRPLEEHAIDHPLVAQLTDAWIPAVFRKLERPNPVPTIDLTIHFRAELPLPADWVLSRFESRHSARGFIEEDGTIWARDGTLIAQSRQLALLQAPSQA